MTRESLDRGDYDTQIKEWIVEGHYDKAVLERIKLIKRESFFSSIMGKLTSMEHADSLVNTIQEVHTRNDKNLSLIQSSN